MDTNPKQAESKDGKTNRVENVQSDIPRAQAAKNAILSTLGLPKVVSLPKLVEHQKTKFRSTEKIEGSFQMAVARLMWTIGPVTITASIYRERERVDVDGKQKERRYLRASMPQGWSYDYRDDKAVTEVREFQAACLEQFKLYAKTNAPELLDLSKAPANATTVTARSGKAQPDGAEVYDLN